jgi:feruloyl esterase
VLADNFADRNIGLANGFAVVSTNTGMEDTSGDCSWAAGNPNLVTDFAYNGIHSAATTAKLLLQIYYAHAPIASYYNSCSDGGHDGLEEAERFPTDYNGIVAGAPLLGAGTIYSLAWTSTTYAALPASQAMTSAQLAYITAVINLKCDALDGLDDGIVSDPQDCAKAFVPTRDLRVCTAGLNPNSCLTAAQLSAYIKATGPVMSNGVAIYPGQALGSEANLLTVQIPSPGQPLNQAASYFYADTAMEYLFPWPNTNTTAYRAATFNYNTAPAKLMTFRTMFDAMSLDLDPFFNAGGRLRSKATCTSIRSRG